MLQERLQERSGGGTAGLSRPAQGYPRGATASSPGPPASQAFAGRASGSILWAARVPLRLRGAGGLSTARRGHVRPGSPQPSGRSRAASPREGNTSQGAGPAPPASAEGLSRPGERVARPGSAWRLSPGRRRRAALRSSRGGSRGGGRSGAPGSPRGGPTSPQAEGRRAPAVHGCCRAALLPGASRSQRLREPVDPAARPPR